jgi:hypothetical protein
MGPFGLGVLLGFVTLLLLLFFLRYVLLHLNKLFGQTRIPFVALEESTDWLNFIVSRVLTHFQRDDVIDAINRMVTSKINSTAGPQFRLLTLGNPPLVPAVYTFKTDDPSDLRILVPIEWASGPGFEIRSGAITVEGDVRTLRTRIIVLWPPATPRTLRVHFDHDIALDVGLAIRFGSVVRLSLTGIPLIGAILKAAAGFIITRHVFEVELPIGNCDQESTEKVADDEGHPEKAS